MKDLPVTRYDVTFVEVFAVGPLTGNLLPVIHDADDLSEDVAARFAQQMRRPETSYLQLSTTSSADYRHRIFTASGELPFAGHPSLGAAAAVCHRRGQSVGDLVQETASGEQRLHVTLNGASGRVTMWQNEPAFGPEVDPAAILTALAVDPGAVDSALPAQVVSTGLPALLIPLRTPTALATASFSAAALEEALHGLVADPVSLNCYLVSQRSPGRWQARSFALDTHGGEDPATGSAAGALGAYLRERRGVDEFVIDQGVEMGEPSRLHIDSADGIRVEGQVSIRMTGTVNLPSARAAGSRPR